MKPEENTFNPAPSRTQVPVPPPSSHLVLAILTTVLCCLPLGIVSIVYASKVDSLYSVGDIAGATYNSLQARKWDWPRIGGHCAILPVCGVLGRGRFVVVISWDEAGRDCLGDEATRFVLIEEG